MKILFPETTKKNTCLSTSHTNLDIILLELSLLLKGIKLKMYS